MTSIAVRQYPRQRATGHHAGAAVRVRDQQDQQDQRLPSRGPAGAYLPPGWPEEVLAPGVPDWEQSAIAWLLDQCPADYRAYPVLRRHPLVLARFAAHFVEGQVASSRAVLAGARANLGGYVDGEVLDRATEAIQAEGARLVRVHRAVLLVEDALKGGIFVAKL